MLYRPEFAYFRDFEPPPRFPESSGVRDAVTALWRHFRRSCGESGRGASYLVEPDRPI